MVNSRTIKKLAKANRRIRSWFAGEKKGEGHHYAVISVSGWQRGLHQSHQGEGRDAPFFGEPGVCCGRERACDLRIERGSHRQHQREPGGD